jgi:hypothetical protein
VLAKAMRILKRRVSTITRRKLIEGNPGIRDVACASVFKKLGKRPVCGGGLDVLPDKPDLFSWVFAVEHVTVDLPSEPSLTYSYGSSAFGEQGKDVDIASLTAQAVASAHVNFLHQVSTLPGYQLLLPSTAGSFPGSSPLDTFRCGINIFNPKCDVAPLRTRPVVARGKKPATDVECPPEPKPTNTPASEATPPPAPTATPASDATPNPPPTASPDATEPSVSVTPIVKSTTTPLVVTDGRWSLELLPTPCTRLGLGASDVCSDLQSSVRASQKSTREMTALRESPRTADRRNRLDLLAVLGRCPSKGHLRWLHSIREMTN